ncbi:GntR family transcriptional regulator [Methylobacterium gregans]|uniref:HTH-type transcriptional repressor NagR n=1 Tax=Methylobacterium gregans TaxID=374424 RepID=A0AA37MCH3_9HYPH|nr:GntR family transcriptional regulator [Methylobacterium gregans]GJD79848.1 HTH-type transcriptional repressor NagR [Methylobacterium gregans]GLS53978.1 GntR family transcriptional regulator [Methylobacterium gregans]
MASDDSGAARAGLAERPSLMSLVRLRGDTAMPLYQQVEEQIYDLITSGLLPPGSVLPAERQLAESLGVSRVTVQRAYAALRQRKLLDSQGRRGFLVRTRPDQVQPGMDRLKGFTEEMRELGKIPSTRILDRIVVQDRSISSIFGLPANAPFLRLTRIRYGDEIPMSREVAWYNLGAAPALEHGDLTGSVYAFLAEHAGTRLVRCDQTVEATMPTAEECAIFDFEGPAPCLLIKRCSFTADAMMIEYVEGLFRGDMYRYRLTLRA